jgi:LysM repeat protein
VPPPSSPSELIAAVNSLRAAYGYPPYQPDAILMSIAQTHAEYLASISMSTVHIDAQGRRPFQRALDAGYLVAGDLSQGGWFSENVTGGAGLTAQQAVDQWMGDAPHQGTMLSLTLQDVGAGVAAVGNTLYYVLDAGLSTGGTPVAYTPPPPLFEFTPTIIPNTPDANGQVIHIVQSGDTLGSISIAYDVPLGEILALNGLTIDSTIYPEQRIVIASSFTPTPTLPTATPTTRPTITPWPSSTATLTASITPPAPTPAPGLPASTAGGAVGIIIITALVLAALLTLAGKKNRSSPG